MYAPPGLSVGPSPGRIRRGMPAHRRPDGSTVSSRVRTSGRTVAQPQ
ncbi:hypothetical protein KPATCC21470_3733 [Kitasatospora purpeofusca]